MDIIMRKFGVDFLSKIFLANREEERLVSFGRERREGMNR